MNKKTNVEPDVLPRIKTCLNAHLFPVVGQKFHGVISKTIPDQALPISEILKRFTRGIHPDNLTTPVYDETGSMPDPKSMDLTDWYELREEVKADVEGFKKSLDDLNNTRSAPQAAILSERSESPLNPKRPAGEAPPEGPAESASAKGTP